MTRHLGPGLSLKTEIMGLASRSPSCRWSW